MLAWFSIQILVNSKIFKLLLNLSLEHLRAQIACYKLKGDLSPVLLKEIFHESCENFEITRICMENHASMTGWQKLFSHTNASNFRWLLQSLILRYTAENSQVTYRIYSTISRAIFTQIKTEVN